MPSPTQSNRSEGLTPTLGAADHAVERPGDICGGRLPPRRPVAVWLVLMAAAILSGLGGILIVRSQQLANDAGDIGNAAIPTQYDPDRAMSYLVQLCSFGNRRTGSNAMKQQQSMLLGFFQARGGVAELQSSTIRHPLTGDRVPMANLIARWYPHRPIRFLLCAHYDTRPFPDRDRDDPKGEFVGANDGASGTAVLMELAHQFNSLPPDIGVDVVLFDAEEFVFAEGRDAYFLGSTYFAQQYRMNPPAVNYRAGVLLDMVGDRELQLLYERNSLRYAREVTKSIWQTAARLGVSAFVPRTRMQEIRDDHLPLNEIARIPTTDLIDFDYPRSGFREPQYWHTQDDRPENCSGESLATVGWVVHQWMVDQSEAPSVEETIKR